MGLFADKSRKRLAELIDKRVLKTSGEPFTLSTGVQSRFYFDCKALTLDGEGLSLVADALLAKIDSKFGNATAVGGLTMGADFITAVVAMKGFELNRKLRYGSIVRKETKSHGTRNRVENQLEPGTKIVVVDDVITSGDSTIRACHDFRNSGYEVVGIIVLIDRQQGGRENLMNKLGNIPFYSIFKREDFPRIDENDEYECSQPAIGSACSA